MPYLTAQTESRKLAGVVIGDIKVTFQPLQNKSDRAQPLVKYLTVLRWREFQYELHHQLLNQFISELLLWMGWCCWSTITIDTVQSSVEQGDRTVRMRYLTVCWSCRVFDGVVQV
jgi:hypothetical protein